MTLAIRPFRDEDEATVIALWQATKLVQPGNDPRADIARKRAVQPELFLVGEHERVVVASAMAGYDGHRGWVYYLAVHPSLQRRGYARAILAAAEEALAHLGCPKLNLQVRAGNEAVLHFYEASGFARESRVSLGKRLPER